jgi:uncharacterized protein YjbJ (UPF0337 family)
MTWDQIESQWMEFAGSEEDDWHTITSTKGHLVGRIQIRYGIAGEEAGRQVDEWSGASLDIVEASRTH